MPWSESGSNESHKHYYYGSKMCRTLDTAWRIIKTFLWILHYSNKAMYAMYAVGSKQPPMRFWALGVLICPWERKVRKFLTLFVFFCCQKQISIKFACLFLGKYFMCGKFMDFNFESVKITYFDEKLVFSSVIEIFHFHAYHNIINWWKTSSN